MDLGRRLRAVFGAREGDRLDRLDQAVADHVERFNRGVSTGDFTEMVEHLAPDVVMTFLGVAVGPFHGRDEVLAAYAAQPPDDELKVLAVHVSGAGSASVDYAWCASPDVRAGEMVLHRNAAGDIDAITVAFA